MCYSKYHNMGISLLEEVTYVDEWTYIGILVGHDTWRHLGI